jgi:hypothetical protein
MTTFIKAPVQHYPYKLRYMNPAKMNTPDGDIQFVDIIFEDEKKDKVVRYDLTIRGNVFAGTQQKKEVSQLPDGIVLE